MRDKKILYSLINFLRALIYFSGVAFLLSLISKKGGIILTYHSVDNVVKSFSGVSQKNFEKQIGYLASPKKVISLEELVTNIKNGIEIPKGCVVITFDDGYKNNYVNAYPILKKYNMPFTIFLATDYIGSGKLTWYDELSYKIKQSNCESIMLKTNNSQRYNIRNEKEKIKTIDSLFRDLIYYNNEKRDELFSELDTKLNVKVPKQYIEDKMLSWGDVKDMDMDVNVSFGAHTCSHCKLTSVSLDDARKEITESKHIIEEEMGKRITFFSYPYGGYNERIKQILKEGGFECAVTINYGKNRLESDLFELKRIGVNYSLWLFKYNLMCVDFEEKIQNMYYRLSKKREKQTNLNGKQNF